MRFQTEDQRRRDLTRHYRQWRKKFCWRPVEADTHDGRRTVWLERVYRRLAPGQSYYPGTRHEWEYRVVEYHVQQLLTKDTVS